jgi:hypothetical protein
MTAVFPLFSKPFPGSDNFDGTRLERFWDALDAWCEANALSPLSNHIAVDWDEDAEELAELAPEDGEWFLPETLIVTLQRMQADQGLLLTLDDGAREELDELLKLMQSAQTHGAQWRFFIDV